MITYELAKKLKDKGYPMPGKEFDSWQTWTVESNFDAYYAGMDYDLEPTLQHFTHGMTITRGHVYIPTLEELIEACGNDFKTLYKDTARAQPYFLCRGGDMGQTESDGSTPSEAVANLWLKLNP